MRKQKQKQTEKQETIKDLIQEINQTENKINLTIIEYLNNNKIVNNKLELLKILFDKQFCLRCQKPKYSYDYRGSICKCDKKTIDGIDISSLKLDSGIFTEIDNYEDNKIKILDLKLTTFYKYELYLTIEGFKVIETELSHVHNTKYYDLDTDYLSYDVIETILKNYDKIIYDSLIVVRDSIKKRLEEYQDKVQTTNKLKDIVDLEKIISNFDIE